MWDDSEPGSKNTANEVTFRAFSQYFIIWTSDLYISGTEFMDGHLLKLLI